MSGGKSPKTIKLDEIEESVNGEEVKSESEGVPKLPEELLQFVKKLDIENMSGKRFEVWLTNEQVYIADKDEDSVEFNRSFYLDMQPDAKWKFSENLEYAEKLVKLFDSYSSAEEVRKA